MPFPLDPAQVRALLECYLRAKDLNRPALIADCFAADAELSFSLANDDIDFPPRVTGAAAIASTLVEEFGERFERCRTYYVCVEPAVDEHGISAMPWLVVMRQKDNGALRIGHGTYRWQFAPDSVGVTRIAALHIHITRMDTIDDPDATKLDALHAAFGYPWLPARVCARAGGCRGRAAGLGIPGAVPAGGGIGGRLKHGRNTSLHYVRARSRSTVITRGSSIVRTSP